MTIFRHVMDGTCVQFEAFLLAPVDVLLGVEQYITQSPLDLEFTLAWKALLALAED